MATDLQRIYSAAIIDKAELMLAEFEEKWDKDYRSIALCWRRNWARITPFFDHPPEIRKVIYTTKVIESINMILQKSSKTAVHFLLMRLSASCFI